MSNETGGAFTAFSPAAVLYARNAEVVDQMYSAMHASIRECFDALRSQLVARLGSRVQVKDTKVERRTGLLRFRYWSLDEDQVYLWGDMTDPRAIVPGELGLWAYTWEKNPSPELQRALSAVAHHERLTAFCAAKKTNQGILKMTCSLDPGNLSPAVEVVAELLVALHDAEVNHKTTKASVSPVDLTPEPGIATLPTPSLSS
jgi:hypothetical protein